MYIFYNPSAGCETEWCSQHLRRKFPESAIIATMGKEDFKRILRSFSTREERIGVMGGDGTLSCAANILAGNSTALGIIPTGRGNDFATGLGISLSPDVSLKKATTGDSEIIDLGRVNNNQYFINSFGVGLDAYVASKINSQKIIGGGYKLNTIKGFFNFPGFRFRAEIFLEEGKKNIDEEVLMVVFGNGRTEGGGFPINIGNNPFVNGFLGMTIIKNTTLARKLFSFPLFLTKFFYLLKFVDHFKIKKADVQIPKNIPIHRDGELCPEMREFVVSVDPKKLKIIPGRSCF